MNQDEKDKIRADNDFSCIFKDRYAEVGRSIANRHINTHETLVLDLIQRGATVIEGDGLPDDITKEELELIRKARISEARALKEIEIQEIRDENDLHNKLFYVCHKIRNFENVWRDKRKRIIERNDARIEDRKRDYEVFKHTLKTTNTSDKEYLIFDELYNNNIKEIIKDGACEIERYETIYRKAQENGDFKELYSLDLYFQNPVLSDLKDSQVAKYNKLVNKRKVGDSLLEMLKLQTVKELDEIEKDTIDYVLFSLAEKARRLAGFESLDDMMEWVVFPSKKERHIFTQTSQYSDLNEFYAYLQMNKEIQNWNVLGVTGFRVNKGAFEKILHRHLELFGIEGKTTRHTTQGDKKLGVLKDELVAYYKKNFKEHRQDFNRTSGKTAKQKLALSLLRHRMYEGARLSQIELEIMPRIGAFITLKPERGLVDETVKNFVQSWFYEWKFERVQRGLEE